MGWRYFCGPDSLVHLGNREIEPKQNPDPDSAPESAPTPVPEPTPVIPEGYASTTRLTLRFGSEFGGWIDLHSRRENFFHATKLELYEDIALTLGASVAYQRAQFAQRERVKELSCLYQIARLSAEQDQPIDELLTNIVSILPPAWLHADVAAACIQLDEHRFATDGFALVLQDQGVIFVPGKAANAGGVACSGLEMSQNGALEYWTSEEVDRRLRQIMANIHKDIAVTAEQYGAPGSYLDGANINGFLKVAHAMIDQGVG